MFGNIDCICSVYSTVRECTVYSTAPVVSSEHHQAQLQSVSARQGDIIHRATNTDTTSHLTPYTLHLTLPVSPEETLHELLLCGRGDLS